MHSRVLIILAMLASCAWFSPAAANDEERLAELTELRERYPQDVDHALARGQVLARLGNDEAALRELREATRLAPDYEDVWRVRMAVLLRQDDEETQQELQEVIAEASRRFPGSSWWQGVIADEEPSWTITAGAGYERLDNDAPSWNRLFANASHARHWGGYRFGLSRDSRFDATDITTSIGANVNFGDDWSAGLDVAIVNNPAFQPESGYSAHVGRILRGGWEANLRYLRRNYSSATVSSVVAAVEKYAGDFRIAYSLGHSHLHGAANTLNHSLTLNWYYSTDASIGINVNTGEESEAIAAGQVLQTDVNGIGLTGRRRINERTDLNWWLGTHKQGAFYRRSFLGMAVTYRF